MWLAVLVTVVIFPVLLFAIEYYSLQERITAKDVGPGLTNASVDSMWTLMGFNSLAVSSLGGKIAVIIFGFVSLIITTTYTANLAAALTVNQLHASITSMADLTGRAVTSNGIYLERLRTRFGVIASDMNFDSYADIVAGSHEVLAGRLAALITDKPFIDHLISQDTTCNLASIPGTIEPFSYGIAFKKGTPVDLVHAISGEVAVGVALHWDA
jgi:hypothetical protein